ncbi:MAG: sulfatase [Phycisphaerales bacterium]|nr:sulfatase [Phycisphaerales bacterium]
MTFGRSLGRWAAPAAFVASALPPFAIATATFPAARDPGRPNVVVILTDDQGYADVGCFGAKGFDTPTLDRLASEGMRFTNFYVAQAVCSASRTALLTGCYPNRVGILGALGPKAVIGLAESEQTLAELLKDRGYACGAFGKWHLGHRAPFLPTRQGFDEFLGLPYSNDMWPVGFDGQPLPPDHWKAKAYPPLPLLDGEREVDRIETLEDQSTLTRRYTERAVAFVDAHADGPFLLYLAHSMPHVPLGCDPAFRGRSEQGLYGDVIMEIDWSVGEVLAALDRHDLANDTIVIFTSDNGPWLNFGNHAGSAVPLREGKGSMWEGGCRVPCIVRWPGHVPAGTDCASIAATIDVLPTVVEATGAQPPALPIDGVSLMPILRGDPSAAPRQEYWYYYDRQLQAVRHGRWKLHLPHEYRSYVGVEPGRDGWPGPYATGRTAYELYDLEADPGERRNVADLHPETVEALKERAEAARNELGDQGRPGAGCREPGRAADETPTPTH